MLLHFIGADHEVTGSCHIIETNNHWIMIDRGMEQGKDIYENADLPCKPSDIDAILLTHAHIDHSGLLPLMHAEGFQGKIYATKATCDLCDVMLRDSAHIQEFEAEWRNRKGKRLGQAPYEPVYTMQDAMAVIEQFVPKDYGTVYEILDGVKVRYTDVGHLLGSACIEVWVTEGDKEVKLVFSGDLGNTDQPILRDPQTVDSADYLIIESTYGDRLHDRRVDYVDELTPIIQKTLDRGGNVVIPSFAVGRTQEMLYFIRQIKAENRITGHDDFTVIVDSPLANEATTIFTKHSMDCYDDKAKALIEQGINPIGFRGLKLSITSDDSKAINADPEPKVILSASGMCDAGRIKHHLKHNLWRPESTVLFVGYQAEGTLGRALIDGAHEVKLFGESVTAAAEICELPGISGHADQNGLLAWAGALKEKPRKTFVVHGEDSVCDIFADLLHEKLGYDAEAPYSGAVFDLIAGEFTEKPAGIPIVKEKEEEPAAAGEKRKTAEPQTAAAAAGGIEAPNPAMIRNPVSVYARLVDAARKLWTLVNSMKGRSKKEVGNMLDELNDLITKYEDND
ncbi:MAG: MBL fold metallo-hydrolase [Lachnospiraceae bacterium]|nr:MBL fold metallo-hydrolase [Lachnospiraceae bacterium]